MKTLLLLATVTLLPTLASAATLSCRTNTNQGWDATVTATVTDSESLRDVVVTQTQSLQAPSTERAGRIDVDTKYRPRKYAGYVRFLLNDGDILLPQNFSSQSRITGRFDVAANDDTDQGTDTNLYCTLR